MNATSKKYFIDEDYFESVNQAFPVSEVVKKFAEAVKGKSPEEADEAGKKIFEEYASALAKHILQTEKDVRDRTAELIYEVAEKTGHHFPSIPQRLIEMALLSTRLEDKWRWVCISYKRLAYSVKKCTVYDALVEAVGKEIADTLPCRHYCIALSETFYKELNMDVGVKMKAALPTDGHCQFDGFYHFE
ncbi:MAG: hypothetical protein D6734_04345 [Candidatus Schekmanbacteria bacterium]|nr:MAG: hypothetical protein D6734_04345 [Candidatus Schekmanbacteria bacterium]